MLVPHKVILDAPSVNGLLRRLLDLADGTLLPYPLLLLRARVCCRGGLCTLLVTVNRLPTFLADHLRTRRRLVSWLVLLRCRRCATNSAHRSHALRLGAASREPKEGARSSSSEALIDSAPVPAAGWPRAQIRRPVRGCPAASRRRAPRTAAGQPRTGKVGLAEGCART